MLKQKGKKHNANTTAEVTSNNMNNKNNILIIRQTQIELEK